MSVDPTLGLWAKARQTASWRGVPFRVLESQVKRGRKQAVHEYPFRDTVWVEDLNRAPRTISFRGFVVGDNVDAQRQQILAANETPGPGTVVHPALGSLTASLLDCVVSDSLDGRMVQLEFTFLESGARAFPTASTNTQATVGMAAAAAPTAIAASFAQGVAPQALVNIPAGVSPALPAGTIAGSGVTSSGANYVAALTPAQGVIAGVQTAAEPYFAAANAAASSVALATGAVAGLSGNFGRFSLGALLSASGVTNAQAALTQANAAAASVAQLVKSANSLAGAL